MNVRNVQYKSEERFSTPYVSTLGIQAYGKDNLYPQMLRRVVLSSPTGQGCLRRYTRFIEGNGLLDIGLSEKVIDRRGNSVDALLQLMCADLAMYGGLALHINYNIFGQIVEVNHVPFEMCRLEEADDMGRVNRIVVHPDWLGRQSRKGKTMQITRKTCDYLPIFNPRREVVMEQMDNVGGEELYRGQILYFGQGYNRYPISRADSVITEMSTDEGLANVKYRNVRNNFLPAGMLFTYRGADTQTDDLHRQNPDEFSEILKQFQGDSKACRILEVVLESNESKPEYMAFPTNNFDKEFTATEESVTARIYAAYGQENFYCIRTGKVGFSGDVTRDAFDVYNSEVNPEQRTIERILSRIFEHWYEPINADYSIEPLKYITNAVST